jgi:hypothetical protein
MNYNICSIEPQGYIHSGAFTELIELVGYGLQDLGHSVTVSSNGLQANARNILIGVHLLDISVLPSVPKDSIIINTEQFTGTTENWRASIFTWASNFETWDYSKKNIDILKEKNVSNIKLLRIGYHKNLQRIPKSQPQDIDVLFYGGINARRQHVFNELQAQGYHVVAKFGIYGPERDDLIARSKLVLNLHYYESKIFEIVRVFYLMCNAKAVVGEVDEATHLDSAYLSGFQPSRYADMVATCKALLDDTARRLALEQNALATISQLPQHELMAPLLG